MIAEVAIVLLLGIQNIMLMVMILMLIDIARNR